MRKARHTLSVIKNSGDMSAAARPSPAVKTALARLSRLLILDRYGYIRSCGRDVAALADGASRQLVGQQVKRLLPALPIHADTPGFNIAYAVFQAGAERSSLIQLKKSSGCSVTVAVSFTVIETSPEYLLSLEIREHASLSAFVFGTLASTQDQPIFRRCA
jgi:hypothetical protein